MKVRIVDPGKIYSALEDIPEIELNTIEEIIKLVKQKGEFLIFAGDLFTIEVKDLKP